jgi:hypothetical protein
MTGMTDGMRHGRSHEGVPNGDLEGSTTVDAQ